ncbi:hypothetical protein K474DRAFT_1666966 [Panus rudis PR-1116 ss-1]|nr:hypothetical protein K474DRAFT_1666966 [Panus rudis PR-1116 ss-1]
MTHSSLISHHKKVHQMLTVLRFGDGSTIEVRRDPGTRMFHCAWHGCEYNNIAAKYVQAHATKHHDVQEATATSIPPTHQAVNDQDLDDTKDGYDYELPTPRGRRSRRSSRRVLSDTYRRAASEEQAPDITRTQRAMVRNYYNAKHHRACNIAEYMKLTPKAINYALRNKAGDDLSQDHLYLDGRLGDIINLDSDQDHESTDEDIEAAESSRDASVMNGYQPEERRNMMNLPHLRLQLPRRDVARQTSELTSCSTLSAELAEKDHRIRERNIRSTPEAGPSVDRNIPVTIPPAVTPARQTPDKLAEEDHRIIERNVRSTPEAGSSVNRLIPFATPPAVTAARQHTSTPRSCDHSLRGSPACEKQPDTVLEFLQNLKYPCGHLLQILCDFGVTDIDRLILFASMPEHWEQARNELTLQGMSFLEWLVLQSGLQELAARWA